MPFPGWIYLCKEKKIEQDGKPKVKMIRTKY